MAIATLDELVNALANNSSRIVVDKANIGTTTAVSFVSTWRTTGQPGQGAVPTSVAVPDHTTVGAMPFTQQTAPVTSYLATFDTVCGNNASTYEIHDRLAHMGGLSGTVTTAQTVGIDLNALTANNVAVRKGDANFSDIMWWLEWYTPTGGTGVNITVNVTYNDGTSGNLTAIALAATRPTGFMQPLNGFIPSADSGKYIRSVNNVTLSATTGTAGNFGVTATRYRSGLYLPLAGARYTSDWVSTGLPEIYNSSCLFGIQLTATTSMGYIRATGKIIHG